MPDAYLSVRDVNHPLATQRGNLREHQRVLFDRIGLGPHPCHWCQRPVDWLPRNRTRIGKLVTDHLDDNGLNNTPENLVPSCQRCNTTRNSSRTVKDDEIFMLHNDARIRAIERMCAHCGLTFRVSLSLAHRQGKFCSRACSHLGNNHTRISADDVRAIRMLARTGTSQKVLAARYAVTPSNVSMIVNYKSFRNIS